jgi:hypothetical protein
MKTSLKHDIGNWHKATGAYAPDSERIPPVAWLVSALFFVALFAACFI